MQTGPANPTASFRAEVLRTADRLRGLSEGRLSAVGESGQSAADRAFEIAVEIVAVTQTARGRPLHHLPRLAPYAVADQLAVVGLEVADLAENGAVAPDVLDPISAELLALRRAI